MMCSWKTYDDWMKKKSLLLSQNFHLMDYHLAIFITVMLARRLVWTIVSEVNTQTCVYTISLHILVCITSVGSKLESDACATIFLVTELILSSFFTQVSQSSGGSLLRYVVLIAARLSLLTMCGWVLCWTLVNLCKNHSVLNLLFLGYPWVFHLSHKPHKPSPRPRDAGCHPNRHQNKSVNICSVRPQLKKGQKAWRARCSWVIQM